MNDDFLTGFRKQPRPEFARELYKSISRPPESRSFPLGIAVRRVIPAAVLIVLIFVLGLTTVVPTAGAQVGAMLQRFGLVLVNPTPTRIVPQASATAGVQPQAHEYPLTKMSLEEAQAQVPFKIQVPGWLPEGVGLKGVVVGTGPSSDRTMAPISVVVSFGPVIEPPTTPLPGGFVQMTQGRVSGGYAVDASKAEDAVIKGKAAVYMPGQNQRDGLLSWQDDSFTYVLSASNLGLSRDELVKIAESLH